MSLSWTLKQDRQNISLFCNFGLNEKSSGFVVHQPIVAQPLLSLFNKPTIPPSLTPPSCLKWVWGFFPPFSYTETKADVHRIPLFAFAWVSVMLYSISSWPNQRDSQPQASFPFLLKLKLRPHVSPMCYFDGVLKANGSVARALDI